MLLDLECRFSICTDYIIETCTCTDVTDYRMELNMHAIVGCVKNPMH
jgi:hypothetical protein